MREPRFWVEAAEALSTEPGQRQDLCRTQSDTTSAPLKRNGRTGAGMNAKAARDVRAKVSLRC